jgi:hypothetical protein
MGRLADTAAHQHFAEKFASDPTRIATKEGAVERPNHCKCDLVCFLGHAGKS